MWPLLLDSSEEECLKTLRRLELEAYGSLVSALRAQGGLTSEKLKILKDTANALHITPERHRAEIRRAVNDEQLATIAQYADGPDTYAEWSVEGRRKVRLVSRMVPQTAFLAVARKVADAAQAENAKMPWPAATARPPAPKPPQPAIQQMKYEPEDRMPIAKKRRRISQDSVPPPSYVPSIAKHRIQKHGISKIQQMYKNQSRVTANLRQQMEMPPPRGTIKTLPPVKQRGLEITTSNPITMSSFSSNTLDIDKVHQPVTVAKVIQPMNKSLIKFSQNQSQKLVIVSAASTMSTTNKVTPINTTTLKLKTGEEISAELGRNSKVHPSQVIVSKSQLTPIQTLSSPTVGGGEKPKVLTVQAKVRPQGSIIVPLQAQNSAVTGGQFAGVSVPVLQGVQWKAIQGKSTVKLLPLGGNTKIIQKPGTAVTGGVSTPIYVMSKQTSNIVVNKNALTTCVDTETTNKISNITHIRPLSQKSEEMATPMGPSTPGKVLVVRKAIPINIPAVVDQQKDEPPVEDKKSTVLQDALQSSGVDSDDIESQISQYTVISKNKWPQEVKEDPPVVKANIQLQDTKYLTLEEAVAILGDNSETRALLSHLQVESTPADGQLDPQTGIYSPIPPIVTSSKKSLSPPPEHEIIDNSTVNSQPETTTTSTTEDVFSTTLSSADIQLEENVEYFENTSTETASTAVDVPLEEDDTSTTEAGGDLTEETTMEVESTTPLLQFSPKLITDKQLLSDLLDDGDDSNR